MRTVTITLNPAYDIHASAENFEPFRETLASVLSREAGGKGINISRALKRWGVRSTAAVVLGTENGEEFRSALLSAGLELLCFEREGRIRENLTLHTGSRETRISFSGFRTDASVLDEIKNAVKADEDTLVTFTGRVPDGIGADAAEEFLLELKAQGARIVLDSKSLDFEHICRIKPWLIKPNREEVSEYFGCEINSAEKAAEKAAEFYRGGVENAAVSLGEKGLLMACGEGIFEAKPPKIETVSTVGAGDSAVAGFIAASAEGKRPWEALGLAAAFGTAACLTKGSMPPEKEDIRRIAARVKVRRLRSSV